MRRRARPLAIVAGAALAVAVALPAPAAADGDPASDVLYSSDVFLPYVPTVSRPLAARLAAVVGQARHAGHPIKVALVYSPYDLGTAGSLYHRPGQYAQFVSAELRGAVNDPILVVMPGDRLALAREGSPLRAPALRRIPPPASSSPDALAGAAIDAVRRLSAAAGHPLPELGAVRPGAIAAPAPRPDSHAGRTIALLCAPALLVILGAFALRRRQARRR